MKGLKKLLTGILAATMIISSSITAFAGESTETPETPETPETGNTISIENAYKGETYNIYRMLDLDLAKDAVQNDKGYSYLVNDKWSEFWNREDVKGVYVDLHKSGDKTYVVWKTTETAKNMTAFGKLASAYAKTTTPDYDPIKVDAKKADNEDDTKKITFGGLANGYYMITSTLGTAVTIGSTPTNKDQEIREKNSTTVTEKKVLDAEASTKSYGQSNDAQIGDTVTFRSKVTIAKNSVNVEYHDTMTEGLTWDGVNATHVYKNEACTETEEVTEGITIEAGTAPETFVVKFANDYVAKFTADTTDLYIKYTAKLNDKAQVVDAEGKPVIENNTPMVQYGNGGKYKGVPTETKTYKFAILKYDGADAAKNPLAGAKFQLFDKTKNNALVKLVVRDDGHGLTYRVLNDGETIPTGFKAIPKNEKTGLEYEITTVAEDKITILGVDNRTYTLVETEAPLGFTKIEDKDIQIETDNSLVVEVPNLSGSILPSTGGIGTTIFYILGGILIVAGVAYFIVRRKANAE